MTESTSRSDREKPSSTLNKLSDQPDCREAQRYVVAPRTVIMLHTNLLSHRKQDCKGHEHRAEGCSGACSHLRFFSSAAQSGEEHLHREETGENAVLFRSSEKQLRNTQVQTFCPGRSNGERRDDDRIGTQCLLLSIIIILILLLLAAWVLIPHMTCDVRSWCF